MPPAGTGHIVCCISCVVSLFSTVNVSCMTSIQWSVALKAPRGCRAIAADTRVFPYAWNETDINTWIATLLGSYEWDGYLCYNDTPPMQDAKGNGGHCKGVVCTTTQFVGWLVHSCPSWPSDINPVPEIPHSAYTYGQSFVWVLLPIERLNDILRHISLMESHVYLRSGDIFNDVDVVPHSLTAHVDTVYFNDYVWHIAKTHKWGLDIFEDYCATTLGGGVAVETWMRPALPDENSVSNVRRVRWPDGTTYDDDNDHSKWAISKTSEKPWVYVGDVNHQKSQAHRGGGGMIIIDVQLWTLFAGLIRE